MTIRFFISRRFILPGRKSSVNVSIPISFLKEKIPVAQFEAGVRFIEALLAEAVHR